MTAEKVFKITCSLLDEILENGAINESNVKDYRGKGLLLLSMCQTELAKSEDKETPQMLTSYSDEMTLSDKTCMLVVPYFLASHLLIEENPDMASFYNARYEELRKRNPRKWKQINDVYNTTYNGL